jgi:hypothetical protein
LTAKRSSAPPPGPGFPRIACSEPCDVAFPNEQRARGTVWNVSVRGAYLVIQEPLPPVGYAFRLAFSLPGDDRVIACEARAVWQNPRSVFKGVGAVAAALPPGCGVEFVSIDPGDKARIDRRVKTLHN